MELKFIWVDKYRIIEKTGFNFNHSGSHKFLYKDDILHLLENKKAPIDFGAKITGVTAIAGQNGSGKSSLCEVALLTTATWSNGAFGYDILFEGIVCFGNHIFYHNSIKLKNTKALKKMGYELVSFKESPFEDMKFEWRETFNNGGFIYYSNVLDLRSDFTAMNLANISTQNYISEDYKYSTSYPHSFDKKKYGARRDTHSPVSIYYRGQGYRFTKFYVNHPNQIPFNKPQDFIVKSAYSDNNRWLNLDVFDDYKISHPFRDLERDIFDSLCKKNSQDYKEEIEINKEQAKKAISLLYRLNLIVAMGVAKKSMPEFEIAYQFIYENKISEKLSFDSQHLLSLVNIHDQILAKAEIYIDKVRPYSMGNNYYEGVGDWRFYSIEKIFLPNTDDNVKLLKRFIDLEELLLRDTDKSPRRISNYSLYPQLSSGESSFLTFFSRIYDIIERYNSGYDKRDTLILFIDEAEVGFHPEWKKYYFKWLIDYLNQNTLGYSFQLILTTHSPYLLSDLTSENVLLLQKNKNGNTEVVESNQFKSFGSNIHELLATSFFMKEGFMGEFAKSKIEELIQFLKEEKNSNNKFNQQTALDLISSIGDELIAIRLKDMYLEKYPNTEISRTNEEYLNWLQNEIKRVGLIK